ncbi:MAG: hypothetical protein J7K66_05590, partial [Anaerolineaceae bacterium]|nr:hypothetical protein [Anaerolineaceae bacterium]
MLAAVEKKNKYWLFITLSIFFAVLNLLLTEYLILLELLRTPILFIYFKNKNFSLKETFKKTIKISIPFIIAFLSYSINRLIFNKNAPSYYKVDFSNYFSNPFQAIQSFINKMAVDGVKSGFVAWFKPLFS